MSILQQKLFEYQDRMPELLSGKEKGKWTAQKVAADDEQFVIQRLHRTVPGGDRLFLNRIPASQTGAYFHTHGLPTAVHVLGPGPYEMGVGSGGEIDVRMVVPRGPWYYEMPHERSEHYVRALVEPVYALMLWIPEWIKPQKSTKKILDPRPPALEVPNSTLHIAPDTYANLLEIVRSALAEHFE